MQETSLSDPTDLEQTLNFTIGIDADGFSGWLAWQGVGRYAHGARGPGLLGSVKGGADGGF